MSKRKSAAWDPWRKAPSDGPEPYSITIGDGKAPSGHKAGRSPSQTKRSVSFKESQHPRAPAGAAASKGGEFIPKEGGQSAAQMRAAVMNDKRIPISEKILMSEGQLTPAEVMARHGNAPAERAIAAMRSRKATLEKRAEAEVERDRAGAMKKLPTMTKTGVYSNGSYALTSYEVALRKAVLKKTQKGRAQLARWDKQDAPRAKRRK